jgi:hypothetical protein
VTTEFVQRLQPDAPVLDNAKELPMPYSLELARRIRDRFAALKTPDVAPSRGTRPNALLALALASLGLCAPASGSDGTRLVKRAEAMEKSSEIVVARRTGRIDSLVEKQREGHRCTFHFETWVVDSVLAGKAPWTSGDTVRVFDAEQAKECWRDHESTTKGIEVGWISLKYNSPTMLTDQDSSSSRGILIGHLRRKKDLELYCHGSIERPDQADGIRDFARDSVRSRR